MNPKGSINDKNLDYEIETNENIHYPCRDVFCDQ